MDREVDQERAKIDRLDERILSLLNQRARIAQRIGKRKARDGTGAHNGTDGFWAPSREKRIFERLRALNTGPLADEIVREPLGGAHRNPRRAGEALERSIARHLAELKTQPPVTLLARRYEKFRRVGCYVE